MNRGLSNNNNTTLHKRPYGIMKCVCTSRLPILLPRPSAVYPPPPPKKTIVFQQPMTPLEYISCPCPDSHQPSASVLQCQEKEHHVMVMPKNFIPPPPEEPIDWKFIWNLNKRTRPQPPKNQSTRFEWVKNAVGVNEAFAVPITKDKNGPLVHHYMNVFVEMILKVKNKCMKRLTVMIQGLIELAVNHFDIKKVLDDVNKYQVVKDEEPVNVFDTICRYSYVVANSPVDDESVVYKVLIIIKQDVVNLQTHLGVKKSERQWFLMLNDLTRLILDNEVDKITIEMQYMDKKLSFVRDNIQNAGDESGLWKEFAELKSTRNDLNQKKKKLLTVLI